MDVNLIAQEIIDAVAPLVSGRTINIMDKNAIIIASSDPKRIGTFHQGAAEVIANNHTVSITKEKLECYAGAKEGVNLPIYIDGDLFGVVGIYGNPVEVLDAANLLCVYVRQYFAQLADAQKKHIQSEIRTHLLRLLIFGGNSSQQEIHHLCAVAGVDIVMPARVVAVALHNNNNYDDPMQRMTCMDQLPLILGNAGLLDRKSDIYGVIEGCFVFLKQVKSTHTQKYLQDIYEIACGTGEPVYVGLGQSYGHVEQLKESYKQAHTLALYGKGCSSIDNPRSRMEYMLCLLQSEGIDYQRQMYRALEEGFGSNEIKQIMSSIETYCDCNGSITRAAEILHIHKNTLLYRINKIYCLLGFDKEDDFTKRFFLHLLLTYHRL